MGQNQKLYVNHLFMDIVVYKRLETACFEGREVFWYLRTIFPTKLRFTLLDLIG